MSVPEGLKPFDPKGSLGQIDKYMVGLPEDDGLVESVRQLKNLRVATDKLKAEQKAVRPRLDSDHCRTQTKTHETQHQHCFRYC
jgi:hypothetical protein